ncbi:hypothetical protein Nepgr_016965 [Nepenthes gracilis]|uniref:MADS-box domain-containing protein n=1 Tax=Nepenthes gracilis TaxID=150966 RepID=A0AAD3SQP1_NEPGR|nr:hypothetical protein Nepgr_016965 [Nepenthes gracilis]
MGRRKLEMKKIANNSSRLVTFSKRRSGIFKKANELSTLCAAHIAIVVFSPAGKPFSFGQPNVESVVGRFLNPDGRRRNDADDDGSALSDSEAHKSRIEALNRQLNDMNSKLEAEKKRGEMLDSKLAMAPKIEDLGIDELMNLKKKMEDLRENIKRRINELEVSSSLLLLADSDASSCK